MNTSIIIIIIGEKVIITYREAVFLLRQFLANDAAPLLTLMYLSMLADILLNTKTKNTRTHIYPQQCVGEIDSTPGCHHTHQKRHGDHSASVNSPQTQWSKPRRLHHSVCPLSVTQLTAVTNTDILKLNVKGRAVCVQRCSKCTERIPSAPVRQTSGLRFFFVFFFF